MTSNLGERTFLDPRDKIWSRFIDVAEKRDVARLEQWKGDTEGILIFTGLFAATVATFLVSSLTMLSPDPGSQSVALLSEVLVVLVNRDGPSALPSNLTTAPPAFEVPTVALQVNILWLISLSLSLLCALASTLVQRWARSYVHDARRHVSPRKRGIIYAALAVGVERFHMEDVITSIVTLLHASVFVFFAGLLLLVFSINTHAARILSAPIVIGALVYLVLTLMPLVWHDSPYHTPLSPLIASFCHILSWLPYAIISTLRYLPFSRKLEAPRITIGKFPARNELVTAESLEFIPDETQINWHKYAFLSSLESADELDEMLSYWQSFLEFISSPSLQQGFARALIVHASYELQAFDRIDNILKSLYLLRDNASAHLIDSTSKIVCTLTRTLVEGLPPFKWTMAFEQRVLSDAMCLFYDYGIETAGGLANVLYCAELRADILTRRHGSSDRILIDFVGRTSLLGMKEVRHKIGPIINFLKLYANILYLSLQPGKGEILTASQIGVSWLSIVEHILKSALHAVADNPADKSLPYLQVRAFLTTLLAELNVSDYHVLKLRKDVPETPAHVVADAVSSKYRHLFQAHPELADVLFRLFDSLLLRDTRAGTPSVPSGLPIKQPTHQLKQLDPVLATNILAPINDDIQGEFMGIDPYDTASSSRPKKPTQRTPILWAPGHIFDVAAGTLGGERSTPHASRQTQGGVGSSSRYGPKTDTPVRAPPTHGHPSTTSNDRHQRDETKLNEVADNRLAQREKSRSREGNLPHVERKSVRTSSRDAHPQPAGAMDRAEQTDSGSMRPIP